MDSVRQQKVARLLQKELGEIFRRDAALYLPGALISVTEVRVSADLSVAKVFLSLFPVKEKEKAIAGLRARAPELRRSLAGRVRDQLRVVPELIFLIDDSFDQAARIDELLKK
ncbi:MAG: 30S ribosome-binding factor RbfA [Bacteroidia bacterium]|nr:30S ribosome-binding factor RbfA [Bacteroidia bacterium]